MWDAMLDFLQRGLFSADAADWITVGAYWVAAGLCWRAANTASLRHAAHERMFWIGATGAMIFLGINELFDFQTLLTILAKMQAKAAGWYDNRKPVQLAFVMGLAVAGLVLTMLMLWFVRKLAGSVKLALAGFIFIGMFVLVRAASFHQVDAILVSGHQSFNLGSIQEILGIAIVVVASLIYGRGREPDTI